MSTVQICLQNTSNTDLLPNNHKQYLWELKKNGFEPKVIYDIEGAPLVGETLPFIESLGFKCVAPRFSDNGSDADYGFIACN
jgi:hypothetical protein